MLKALMISTVFALASAGAGVAFAADVTAPVKAVMDITTANWAENANEPKDIFSADLLGRLFSRDFGDKYRAAAKFPAYDGGDSPFDYDVITNGQDGCALEDTTITPGAPVNGVTPVVVKFKNMSCFGSEAEYQALTEVRFDVVDEGGQPVIDDIHTSLGENEFGSLKADMETIAAQ